MEDVRVDSEGTFRCWNCGGKNFQAKRTGRAKVIGVAAVGIGALATQKKLKCRQCGKYNQVGNAKPYVESELTARQAQTRSPQRTDTGDQRALEKSCPFCAESIKAAASKCKHCGEILPTSPLDTALFDVVLVNPGRRKDRVAEKVSEISGLPTTDARDLVNDAPRPVLKGVSLDEAERAKSALLRTGASVFRLESDTPGEAEPRD